jgi:dTDP-4-amino-4,6-dideoxygalactose transaminase
MSIPFVDLAAQFQRLEAQIRARMDQVLAHGKFILGPEVLELEGRLAELAGVSHAVSCSSGTDALLLPLMALDVGPGDAVFTTPFTFIATAEVVSVLRATPVFVDVDRSTFNIDPRSLRRAVERVKKEGRLRPRGIIPVDLFGLPAEYDEINAIAAREGLFVVEDAAQSFGATYRGRPAGGLADAGATSFFPAKPLGCYGDGGAVLTNDAGLAQLARTLRTHGTGASKYAYDRIGINGRLDTLQAAVLLAKLDVFAGEIRRRNEIAEAYNDLLAGVVGTPNVPAHSTSAWAQYTIRAPDRNAIAESLQQHGVPTAIYYPSPLHLQPAFASLGHGPGDFPVAESAASEVLSLPMHPYLSDSQVTRIAGLVGEAVARCAS